MKRPLAIINLLMLWVWCIQAAPIHWALSGVPDGFYNDFHDGMAVFQNMETMKCGAVNTKGKIVIQPQFLEMSDFIGGVSKVKTEEGYGFINKNGLFLFQPDSALTFWPVTGHNEYGEDFNIPGLYRVENNSKKLTGFWYKNRMVLPLSEDRKYQTYFPFITWKEQGSSVSSILNLETGEVLSGSVINRGYFLHEIIIPTPNGNVHRLFTYFGEEMKDAVVSSKGVRLALGNDERHYSIIAQNGDTILSEKEEWFAEVPIWQNDMLLMTKRTGSINNYEYSYRLYNANGRILFERKKIRTDDTCLGWIKGNGVFFNIWNKGGIATEVYNQKGKKVASCNWFGSHIYGDWFWLEEENGGGTIFCLATNKSYPCKAKNKIHDGMLVFRDDKEHYYIINLAANTCLKMNDPNISSVCDFNEGVSVVSTKTGSDYIIDKLGNTILQMPNKDYDIFTSQCSEGVLKIKKPGYKFGYIYNPLKKNNFQYGGKTEHNQWLYDEGVSLYNAGKYARAKDNFYDLILNEPLNTAGINYYGCCLERLGYYDSAIDAFETILNIDPNNQLAKDNIKVCQNNKQAAEQPQSEVNQTMMFFDGLTQFLNVLGNTVSQYTGNSNNVNYSGNSGYSNQSYNSKSNSSNLQSGNDNISKNRDARTYSDLESQLIKMNTYYNTYNDSQRRSIQSQMRSIRQKWESRGFRMFHSSWEDWDGRKR